MAKTNPKVKIEIETPKEIKFKSINENDWNELKRKIHRIPKKSKLLSVIYSLFGGAGITTLLTLLTLTPTSGTFQFYLLFGIFSVLFSLVFLIMDIQKDKETKKSGDEIIDYMNCCVKEN